MHERARTTGIPPSPGIGAIGTVLVGIAAYDEPATQARLAAIALVIAGVIGLRITSPGG